MLTIQIIPFKASWLLLDENDSNLGFFPVILYPLSKPLVLLAYTEAHGTTSMTGVVFTCTTSSFINWKVGFGLTKWAGYTDININSVTSLYKKSTTIEGIDKLGLCYGELQLQMDSVF